MLQKTVITSALVVSLALILPTPIYASYLYFSPSEIKTDSNSSFDVQIRLNTLKDSINAATISINYPTDFLNVTGINYDDSALGLSVENQYKDGQIKITRGSFKSFSGDVSIGKITFQPQKAGTAQLTFSNSKIPKLYDFSDSLDPSQNGTETITISQASDTSSGETNACKTRENVIRMNSKKILDSGENILNSIDHISQSIQNYSQNQTGLQTNADYQFKIANIQLQKTLSQQNLKVAQNDLNSYACDRSDSKLKLAQFKKDVTIFKQSLKNYRQAVRDLVGVLLNK